MVWDWWRGKVRGSEQGNISLRRQAMHELTTRRDIERRASEVISIVLIPSVFGLLGAYSERLRPAIVWRCPLLGPCNPSVVFFAIRLHLPERSVHALLVENEDLAQEKSSLLELV